MTRFTTARSLALLALFPLGAMLLRLGMSDSFLYDEAEQYLVAEDLRPGYPNQPPLFYWGVHAVSRLIGMGLPAIVLVKYACLLLMYAGLYASARCLFPLSTNPRGPDIALVVAGSALLIPQFSAKIIEDLTHTVLMLAVTAWTTWAFLRVMASRRLRDYGVLGLLFGLGMLSKYNYLIPAAALTGSALLSRQHRGAVLNPRFLLAILIGLAVLLPHLVWLWQESFQPLGYAMARGRVGGLGLAGAGKILVSSYWPCALYALVVGLCFGCRLGQPDELAGDAAGLHPLIRRAGLLALGLPMVAIASGLLGFFKAKWLTASMLLLPLAVFSLTRRDLLLRRRAPFGRGVALVGVLVLGARALPGFAPDITGSGPRELIPYDHLSTQLETRIAAHGWNPAQTLLVTRTPLLAANLLKLSSFGGYVIVREEPTAEQRRLMATYPRAVLVWDAGPDRGPGPPTELGQAYPEAVSQQPLTALYRRSTKERYALGWAFAEASHGSGTSHVSGASHGSGASPAGLSPARPADQPPPAPAGTGA
ncbi:MULTISPECIES: glycosyltransferase family 39 protein [Aphanothece]|uniref:glycosyltransferase family 39 protein n=1 Tax=Aphanothece TaxID=1121 RepID=UPI00398EB845